MPSCFTKTGSGQTHGKHSKQRLCVCVSRRAHTVFADKLTPITERKASSSSKQKETQKPQRSAPLHAREEIAAGAGRKKRPPFAIGRPLYTPCLLSKSRSLYQPRQARDMRLGRTTVFSPAGYMVAPKRGRVLCWSAGAENVLTSIPPWTGAGKTIRWHRFVSTNDQFTETGLNLQSKSRYSAHKQSVVPAGVHAAVTIWWKCPTPQGGQQGQQGQRPGGGGGGGGGAAQRQQRPKFDKATGVPPWYKDL